MESFTINGRKLSADVDPEMPLLWVLRDALGMTGTKFGCGLGQCSACTVLVDGKARPSCTLPAREAAGKAIRTIEGVSGEHPVLRAWAEGMVPQCGYCQSGQILQAISLLSENADSTDEEIARAMQRNICRCGTYGRIRRAVRRAAELAAEDGAPLDIAGDTTRSHSQPARESAKARDKARTAADFVFNPFVRIDSEGGVTVIAKHLEMGQGIYTGLATIVAEELDAEWGSVRVESAPADAAVYKNFLFGSDQGTGGSTGIANSYRQYREAGAAARAMLVSAAASEWGISPEAIEVRKGVVAERKGRRSATFGELAERASKLPAPEQVTLKDPARFELIGKEVRRIDLGAKLSGTAEYGIDVRLPGMLCAVVARPTRFGGRVRSFDDSRARAVSGVKSILAIPEGVAVVATDYWSARRGREALRIEWDDSSAETRGTKELFDEYRRLAETEGPRARTEGDVERGFAGAAQIVEATYEFPYLAHVPLEPLNCVVRLTADACEIWTGDQAQSGDQRLAAQAAGLPLQAVSIHTLFAGGSFGRRANPTADFVVEAVHIAKALGAGTPVQLIWSREDDIRGGYYRPMFLHRLKAALDARGNPTVWLHRLVGQSIIEREGVDEMAIEGAFDMPYAIPNIAVELHTTHVGVPVLWWRSVGHSHTAFGVEAFLDELAAAGGRDPVELRRALLRDHPRHLAVLELAAERAGWGRPLPPGRSRGIAVHKSFGSYVAEVAEVSLREGGGFAVDRVVCAVDCGTVVNPDIVRAQMEGGIALGLSAALGEEITLDAGRVEQSDLNSYRLLRSSDMPQVEVHLVPSTEAPTGVGEPGLPPIAPAVANALRAAGRAPVRRLPLLPRRR